MKPEKRTIPSSEHEQVYHAAARCQAASLSLTARRLHGLKNACSVEGKKNRRFCLSQKSASKPLWAHADVWPSQRSCDHRAYGIGAWRK